MPHRKKTREEFISDAIKVHGNKYDYSKVDYINSKTEVDILCPIHGVFKQKPNIHLNGHGCPKCGGSNKLDNKAFIESARKIHGNKYDYSKVQYVNNQTKVCIICHERDEYGDEHGIFWQNPSDHKRGRGCPICAKCKPLTNETFVKKAKLIHGDKYDYSNVNYVNVKTKTEIVCLVHGKFMQKPNDHLSGFGCPKCFADRFSAERKMSNEVFIKKAKEIHGDKYDYSKIEYNGTYEKVCIICPKHGEFWQSPHVHLKGGGCPQCNQSKLEEKISLLLTNKHINFVCQKKFDWLGRKKLDFYIPEYKIAIECQGIQHFETVDIFGGEKGLEERRRLDKEKLTECLNNGINILYYSNTDYDEFNGCKVWHNAEELISNITTKKGIFI